MSRQKNTSRLAVGLIGTLGFGAIPALAEAPKIQYEMVPNIVIPQTIEYKPTPKSKGKGADSGVTSNYVATYVPYPSYTLPYPTAFYPVNDALYPVTQAATLAVQQATSDDTTAPKQSPERALPHCTTPLWQSAIPEAKSDDFAYLMQEVPSGEQAKEEAGREIVLASSTESGEVVGAVDGGEIGGEIMPTGLFGGESHSAWSFSSPIFKIASIPAQSLNAGGAINQNGPRCQTALTVPTSPYPPQQEYNVLMPQYYQLPNGAVVPVQRQGLFKRFCQTPQTQFQAPAGTMPQFPGCGVPAAPQAMMPYANPYMMPMMQAYGMPQPMAYSPYMPYGYAASPYVPYGVPYAMPYATPSMNPSMFPYAMPQQAMLPPAMPLTPVALTDPQQPMIANAALQGQIPQVMSLGMRSQPMPMLLVQQLPQNGVQATQPLPLGGSQAVLMTPDGARMAIIAQGAPQIGNIFTPPPQKLAATATNESGEGNAVESNTTTATLSPQLLQQLQSFQQMQTANGSQGAACYMIVPCGANGQPIGMQQTAQQPQQNGVSMAELALLIAALKDDKRRPALRDRLAARREQRRASGTATDPLAKLMETWTTPSYPADTAMRMPSKNAYPYGYFGAAVGPQQTAWFGGYYDGYAGSTGYPAY